jgi:hypothetical protein
MPMFENQKLNSLFIIVTAYLFAVMNEWTNLIVYFSPNARLFVAEELVLWSVQLLWSKWQ